jgi:hypothetical protein
MMSIQYQSDGLFVGCGWPDEPVTNSVEPADEPAEEPTDAFKIKLVIPPTTDETILVMNPKKSAEPPV